MRAELEQMKQDQEQSLEEAKKENAQNVVEFEEKAKKVAKELNFFKQKYEMMTSRAVDL